MPTYRIDLEYDGAGFHGYARQPDVRTVQGDLEAALFRLTGPVETAVAGRTDAGVHARGQVVSFVTTGPLDEAPALRSLNSQLNPEMAVMALRRVAPTFNARFSALNRTYRYLVWNRRFADPFLRHTAWHVPDPLALGPMNEVAGHVRGEHDFASFCRKADGRGTVRTVRSCRWFQEAEGLFRFEITASSFCHQMVRSIVALSVAVGRRKIDADEVPAVFAARDRNAARGAAPAHGLTLWEVAYPAAPVPSPWSSTATS
jgi:tRNA pseudouridine38-40 synthase